MRGVYRIKSDERCNSSKELKATLTYLDRKLDCPCLVLFDTAGEEKTNYVEMSNIKNGGFIVTNWDEERKVAYL